MNFNENLKLKSVVEKYIHNSLENAQQNDK